VLLLSLPVIGVASAAVPNSATAQITACYPATGINQGRLRVIDYQNGQRCMTGERTMSWQQKGVRYRGTWSPTAAYFVGDVAVYAGSAYISVVANAGILPTNTTKWRTFASRGSVGPQGAKGATGAPGVQGPKGDTGSQGIQGPKGDTGNQGFRGIPGPAGVNMFRDCYAKARWDLPVCQQRGFTAPPGCTPWDITTTTTNLWVTCNEGRLVKFDPHSGTVVTTIDTTLSNGYGVAFDGTYLWMAGADSNAIARVDPSTGDVTYLPLEGASFPSWVVFDGTYVWTANGASKNVSRIDPANSTVQTFALPAPVDSPQSITFDGTYIWVANYFGGQFTRINPQTGGATNFPYPAEMQIGNAILADGTDLWIADTGHHLVARIDPTTGLGHTVNLGDTVRPTSLGFDGQRIWVGRDVAETAVTMIDCHTEALTEVALPSGLSGVWSLMFDGSNMWATAVSGKQLVRLVPPPT
jgi:streptogramin lyase